MRLKSINPREIIASLKPEFAQFQKRVTYKPLYPESFPKVSDSVESTSIDFMTKAFYARHSSVNEQIKLAQPAIEIYAKQKGVNIDMARKIDIIEGKHIDLTDKILIDVFNPKTKENVHGSVPVYRDGHIYQIAKSSSLMLHDPAEGTEVVRRVESQYEDTFVRHLYRTIENLVKRSNNK